MGQIGLDRNSDGTGGTRPSDWQRFVGALFENAADSPVIDGGIVNGTATLQYAYSAGTGVKATGDGAIILTWPAGQTPATAAPASGSATDVVYVTDANGPRLARDTDVPADSIILGKRKIDAGVTATTATTEVWDRKWAISRGMGDNLLGWAHDTYVGDARPDRFLWMTVDFVAQFDMDISVEVIHNIYSQPASEQDLGPGSMRYEVYLDSKPIRNQEIGFDRRWLANSFSFTYDSGVSAGRHKLEVWRSKAWGANGHHFPASGGWVGVRRETMRI